MYDTSSGVLSLCGSCSPHIFLFYFRGCFAIKNNNSKELLINEAILKANGFTASKTVRVVGPDGEQLGLIEAETALENAYDKGLDLVLISPSAEPPVCRIMDYGKYRFERDKKEKEARKKQQKFDIKEIQLSCHIDTNDFNTKVNNARRFLGDGDKVRVVVKFRGRQMGHLDMGRDLLTRFEEATKEVGTVEKQPTLEGRFMSMQIAPIKQNASK
ncbi:MAG: translation initiation factor IF-3 [Clostridia bacterium]|nr:translation initiation factor IF-3 [Clostridia bacterium]